METCPITGHNPTSKFEPLPRSMDSSQGEVFGAASGLRRSSLPALWPSHCRPGSLASAPQGNQPKERLQTFRHVPSQPSAGMGKGPVTLPQREAARKPSQHPPPPPQPSRWQLMVSRQGGPASALIKSEEGKKQAGKQSWAQREALYIECAYAGAEPEPWKRNRRLVRGSRGGLGRLLQHRKSPGASGGWPSAQLSGRGSHSFKPFTCFALDFRADSILRTTLSTFCICLLFFSLSCRSYEQPGTLPKSISLTELSGMRQRCSIAVSSRTLTHGQPDSVCSVRWAFTAKEH